VCIDKNLAGKSLEELRKGYFEDTSVIGQIMRTVDEQTI